MNKKKINKVLKFLLFSLFAVFLTIFLSNEYGYYEYQKAKQVTLTEEQIKKFEEDVRNGEDISIENYTVDINKNYQTNLSEIGLNISNNLSNIVKDSVEGFFNSLSKFITS